MQLMEIRLKYGYYADDCYLYQYFIEGDLEGYSYWKIKHRVDEYIIENKITDYEYSKDENIRQKLKQFILEQITSFGVRVVEEIDYKKSLRFEFGL